jgi:hypothetical protein
MDDARDDTHTTALRTGEDPTLPQQVELAAVGDRCVACGAPLSSDQRYCVNCGERRTAPRFTLAAAAAPAAETVTTVTHRSSPRRRASSGTTMVAGIGTLLLAMGVGVLIGRTNSTTTGSQRAAATNIHVTVGGGTGSGAGSAATTPANSNAGTHRSGATSSKASAAAAAKQAATAKKAVAAAGKVLGSNSKNLPPPNVAVGSTGSGAGYSKKTHKFTGTFFGQ